MASRLGDTLSHFCLTHWLILEGGGEPGEDQTLSLISDALLGWLVSTSSWAVQWKGELENQNCKTELLNHISYSNMVEPFSIRFFNFGFSSFLHQKPRLIHRCKKPTRSRLLGGPLREKLSRSRIKVGSKKLSQGMKKLCQRYSEWGNDQRNQFRLQPWFVYRLKWWSSILWLSAFSLSPFRSVKQLRVPVFYTDFSALRGVHKTSRAVFFCRNERSPREKKNRYCKSILVS